MVNTTNYKNGPLGEDFERRLKYSTNLELEQRFEYLKQWHEEFQIKVNKALNDPVAKEICRYYKIELKQT